MPGAFPVASPEASPFKELQPAPSWHRAKRKVKQMTISIPLVVILGVVVYLAWRYMGLRAWQVVLCLLFGFFLAATAAAPTIRQLVIGFVQWLTSAKP
jgi:hypothetical protein